MDEREALMRAAVGACRAMARWARIVEAADFDSRLERGKRTAEIARLRAYRRALAARNRERRYGLIYRIEAGK